MFTTAAGLIATLGRALSENRLEERLTLSQTRLLRIDEIGYIPIGRQGANLFNDLASPGPSRSLSAPAVQTPYCPAGAHTMQSAR